MPDFTASAFSKARADRRRLKLGTILGSGMLAAAAIVPAMAQAADTSVRYQLATPVMQGSNTLPAGFRSAAVGVTPQDLTVRPLQRLAAATSGGGIYSYSTDITTSTDNTPGITANYNGAVTITAGNITTTGNYSDGITANNTGASSPAPISITVGNISTSGNLSNGIYARAYGDLAVNAGSVSTTGQLATGIYTVSSGNTVIKAGDITTSGAGIQAISGGQMSITAGNVVSYGTGISAMAGGNLNITATSVYSKTGTGINAYSSGGDVKINVGNVYAVGAPDTFVSGISATGHNVTVTAGNVVGALFGVYARAYNPSNPNDHSGTANVTVNGDILAVGGVAHGVTAVSDGTVNVTTTGEIKSASLGFGPFHFIGEGIFAAGYGDVTVNAQGRIKTYGAAIGIKGLSYHGDVSIAASAVNAYSNYSVGVEAGALNGTATVVAGDITMSGNGSRGIVALGGSRIYSPATQSYTGIAAGSVDVTLNGQIQGKGFADFGIQAGAYDGNVAVHNNGAITLGNLAGDGIVALALGTSGNVVIDGQGSITTGSYGRGGGYGVIALSQAGSVSVTQGAIDSLGHGVLAAALNTYGNNAANGININLGSVTTSGTGQAATGIVAVDYNQGSTVTINAGSVTTIGDFANGITANAFGGTVTISGGSISTRGKGAEGVALLGNDYDTVTLNSVATTGLNAAAVDIRTNPFAGANAAINANIGRISTAGDYAFGVVAVSYGTTNVQTGSVTTAGKQAVGVYAESKGGGGVTVNAGSVATAGDGADAIFVRSLAGLSLTETGGITTQGNNASGVIAVDLGSAPVDLTLTGAISTQGGRSAGAVAVSRSADVTVQASSISTAGAGAPALGVYASGGSANVNLGTASTSGMKANAVFLEGRTGVTLTANQISTSGDDAHALIIRSGYYGVVGDATVNVGSITTAGKGSSGIDAFTVGRSSTDPTQTSTLSINVGSITTTGIDSPGISALNPDGAINITAANISTQGFQSRGILTYGGSDINLQVGSISTAGADAIYANGAGSGTITAGVTGAIASSGGNGLVAINTGGATNITVASTGSVTGAADAILVQTGGGAVTVANAGTITGGTGFAVNVTGLSAGTAASTVIDNNGTLVGAVNLAGGGNNTLTNAGTFVATKDSDFGGGASQFVNSGVLKVAPGAAGTVNFLNLATFQNAGGLIDLRSAPVGTVFTLSGDYVASGNARLGLGVNGSTADKLVIGGVATGATTVLLNANPAAATLLPKPLTLVQAGAGSTGTFTLANPNVGLIHYSLTAGSAAAQGPASFAAAASAGVSYVLTASAGAPVYGTLKLEESAQNIWRQSADAVSEHLAAMRGDASGGGAGQVGNSGYGLGSDRYWVQAYGSTSDRNQTVGGFSTSYNQTDAGVQAGADLARNATRLGTVGWGVTAGYTNSQIDAQGATLKSNVDTFNFGGYAVLNHGPYFANALVKFDHHQISTSDSVAGYSVKLSGNSYGAQFELGRHYGKGGWAFEPTVSLNVVRTSLDNVSIFNQSLAFGDENGVSGKIGGRFYRNYRFGNGATAVFYAGAAAVDDFTGDQKATFYSGGTSQNVSAGGDDAYGQAVVGVSSNLRGVTFYLQGEGAFGGSHSGEGVRLGARF